ncbi:MAG: hypothetical protein A2103_01045 [Gammaproteobacteria bacterium GWF2_41_13]|nr:MAG: hypothetical protein A2103_01045 [Gammaproteobacteria bacterium GWF2_41_13]
MKKIIHKLKCFWITTSKNLLADPSIQTFKPVYRIASIEKEKQGDYEITIQLIGKSTVFKMKPEEILANDGMTDQFSPRDVRTLTYLGYLDINSPKYRILAKKLSEKDNRMLFALHKKGDKTLHFKTAIEISQNKEILKQIDQHDAHMVGYMVASEAMLEEKKLKKKLSTD